jgi:hypothetical protein
LIFIEAARIVSLTFALTAVRSFAKVRSQEEKR